MVVTLARTQDTGAPNTETSKGISSGLLAEFVTFTVGADEYGVDIMCVRETRGWVDTTLIPHAPRLVRGVVNLRGDVVPIFDLRSRFGIGDTQTTKTRVVIVVKKDKVSANGLVGIRAEDSNAVELQAA